MSLPGNDKPRLGPFLRQYAEQEEKSPRERVPELLLAGAAAVGMLIVLVAFVRFPFPTFGVLVGVWGIGFVVLTVKQRRANARERALRKALEQRENSTD